MVPRTGVHLMAGVAVSHISCILKGFDMAPYVDYLMFSCLNPITNPTPRPKANLPVYPNYRGSCTQPQLSGLPHTTPTIGAAACNPKGRGSRARPGRGRRCAWASPSQLTLRAAIVVIVVKMREDWECCFVNEFLPSKTEMDVGFSNFLVRYWFQNSIHVG